MPPQTPPLSKRINLTLDRDFGVSRETISRLEQFATLLVKWNNTHNLVAQSSLPHLWERHILDSAQLIIHIPVEARILTDFGTGGGFPGLILAIIRPWEKVHLIESNQKKSAFLNQAASELGLANVHVHCDRIEALQPWESSVLAARALADMNTLLNLLFPFIQKSTLSVFLKGKNVVQELDEASEHWELTYQLHPSVTENEASIITLHQAKRRIS